MIPGHGEATTIGAREAIQSLCASIKDEAPVCLFAPCPCVLAAADPGADGLAPHQAPISTSRPILMPSRGKAFAVYSPTRAHAAKPAPGHRTEIRSRWTDGNLYFLFICPYEKLNLKPDPVTNAETNHLWDWDVAEVFIGTDFQHIRRYKEFEVSPQGEWVDLDIDRDFVQADNGVKWNSGFANKARIDAAKKIWYAEMRIPFAAIDKRKPAAGVE